MHLLQDAVIDMAKFSVPLAVAANLGIQVHPLLAQFIANMAGVFVKTKYKIGGYGHCKEFSEKQ